MMNEAEIHDKIEALLSQMTLEEKAAQMVQIPYSHVGREASLEWAKKGAGSFLHVLGDNAREVQKAAMSSRLGIPVLFGIDAIHGHGLNDHATIFPSQLAQACSWDPEVARETGRVTAEEVAADGLHWTFSPVLCLARDTRWGRVDETFGEDPYLAAELGEAIIRGYQGEDLSADTSILACAKHYIAYGEATGARDAYDSEITWRKLREVFLIPFKRAAEAGCATFMTAYGSIDSTPFTASPKALKQILRDECGFDGFVVTDWDNTRSLITNQHVAADMKDASIIAAKAGNDMIMSTPEFYEAVIQAVKEGKLDEKVLDDAVRHILTIKFRMDLFGKPEKHVPQSCIGSPEHLDSARSAAQKSVTLLKNNGILPLKQGLRVAVLGSNADNIRAQYGDWTYFTHPNDDPHHTPVRPYVTIKEGLEALAGAHGAAVTYTPGCGPEAADTDDITAAVETAKNCDVAVIVVGDLVSQHGEGRDRADLSLSGRQEEMVKAVHAAGIPIILVLLSSKPLCIGTAAELSEAVVCAFNGGMFGGEAVARVLFGENEPEGRLPISFPRHSGQVPVYYNHYEGWHFNAKYCDLPGTPLYAFGEGLGYTTFEYSALTFDTDTLTASVTVKNTGDRAGSETVQAYWRDLVSSIITPVKNLAAFTKVTLQPGEEKTVSFIFKKEDFSLVLPDETRTTESGDFEMMIGHSSKDEDLLKCVFRL